MKESFRCASCNYTFYRNVRPKQCPMCGKSTVEPYRPVMAEDILNDSF